MSNRIIKRINDANKFRERIKTEKISSPNNKEYESLMDETKKKQDKRAGFIPPTEYDLGETLYNEDEILY